MADDLYLSDVVLLADIAGVPAGSRGTVVLQHDDHPHLLVEFDNDLLCLLPDEVRPADAIRVMEVDASTSDADLDAFLFGAD